MGSAAATETPRRSVTEVVEGVRRHEMRLSALVRAYEAAEGEDGGVTDLLRDRGWDAANFLWDVDGDPKDDRLSALWDSEGPIGRVVWILPAVLYALEPGARATPFLFRDAPLRRWVVYALNECCDFMTRWIRDVQDIAPGLKVDADPDRDPRKARDKAAEPPDSLPVTLHVPSGHHVPAMLVPGGNISPPRLELADTDRYGPADYPRYGYAAHLMLSPAVEDLSPGQRNILARWTDACARIRREEQEEADDTP